MRRSRSTSQCIALAGVLLTAACAYGFAPESRSRGDIFDEASRGVTHFDLQDVRLRLNQGIHRAYPPGTPLADVIGHIEGAGGDCSNSDRGPAKADVEMTRCSFENEIYFTEQLFFMGEPTFWLTHNDWTVFIADSDGVVRWYVVEGEATTNHLDREDYMDGVQRQRAEEDELRQTSAEN